MLFALSAIDRKGRLTDPIGVLLVLPFFYLYLYLYLYEGTYMHI